MTAIASPLDRRQLAMQPDRVECIACGGSGVRSRGGKACKPCKGQGSVMRNALVQHSSESNEHYTPAYIVEAARTLMGGIDLDPASCPMAQETVKAEAWYGPGSPFGEDGLAEPGAGRVFCNPPGGLVPEQYQGMGTSSNAALWWAVWSSMWLAGEIDQLFFVGFTIEILRSTQGLDVPWPGDFPLCFPKSRTDFETANRKRTKGKKAGELIDPSKPEGARVKQGAPGHANVLVWLGDVAHEDRGEPLNVTRRADMRLFLELFTPIGRCRT